MRNDLPQDLGTLILDLDRRLETLERSPKAYAPGTVTNVQFREANAPATTSSGTYVSLWESRPDFITHTAFVFTAITISDVGTTGKMRIAVTTNGSTIYLSERAISSVQGYIWWDADMSPLWTVGTSADILIELQARVWTGAGGLAVYPPESVFMVNPEVFNSPSYLVA